VLTSPYFILLRYYYVMFRMIEYSDHPNRLDSRDLDLLVLGSRNLEEELKRTDCYPDKPGSSAAAEHLLELSCCTDWWWIAVRVWTGGSCVSAS